MTTHLDPQAVALVTGAAGGIGSEIVRQLAKTGVSLALVDRPGADFGQAIKSCDDAGVAHLCLEADVRNRSSMLSAAQRASDLGPLKYAVNCAGIDILQTSHTMPESDWQRVLDINLSGILNSCLAEFEYMRAHHGAIVNVASMSAHIVNRGADPHVGYCASKAGVVGLTRSLALEWAQEGIRLNSISPGYTRTDMTAINPPERNAFFASQVPLGRMADVREIAAPVVFLLSDDASYILGQDLLVDGGATCW